MNFLVFLIVLIKPAAVLFPGKGDQVEVAFNVISELRWLPGVVSPVCDHLLQVKESFILALIFVHTKMDKVRVIHIDNSRNVTFQFHNGACEVGTVPFLLVGAEDAYANYHPSCWGGTVPLA